MKWQITHVPGSTRSEKHSIVSGFALKRKRTGELLCDRATSKIPDDVELCFSAPTRKME